MKRLMVGVVILGVLGIVAGVAFISGKKGDSNPPVTLAIQPGWNAARVAGELEAKGVIGSAFWFRAFMRLQGIGGNLRSGQYEFSQDMSYGEVAASLKEGPITKFAKLTIPEGLNIEQTASRVGQNTHITAEAFIAAATAEVRRPSILPANVGSLEGFLYPETYFVIEKEAPADLVGRLIDQFEKETAGLDWASGPNGLSPFQVLVLSSMIEEEANVPEERAKVSAVIHNRIKRGMKLEIDATIQYAVRKYNGEPLTAEELEVDSPYNTRRFPGLPPGPISSPRRESIIAALEPAATDDLFYVLSPDCKHHVFTADFAEFTRAKQQIPDC